MFKPLNSWIENAVAQGIESGLRAPQPNAPGRRPPAGD